MVELIAGLLLVAICITPAVLLYWGLQTVRQSLAQLKVENEYNLRLLKDEVRKEQDELVRQINEMLQEEREQKRWEANTEKPEAIVDEELIESIRQNYFSH